MIYVTRPFLPPKDEYLAIVEEIWERNFLTNDGPCLKLFEQKISELTGVSNFSFLSNGTISIQIAIKALDLKGEIITTPFSYVATTSSLVWEGSIPVFVDIDPETWNIDPDLIEAAITPKTSAIIATHVFGNPCDINAIQKIADKYNLKVIYDAAHAFGSTYNGRSVMSFGDYSSLSFHATKLMHTVEGGGLFTNNKVLHEKVKLMRNFGHNGPEIFDSVGINGKNSEFHAAMGLCNLKYLNEILIKRKSDYLLYNKLFQKVSHLIQPQQITENTVSNYSYYPILFESEEVLKRVKQCLEENEISPRRYFYPLLNTLPYIENKKEFTTATSVSERILCLPHYFDLKQSEIEKICTIIHDCLIQKKC